MIPRRFILALCALSIWAAPVTAQISPRDGGATVDNVARSAANANRELIEANKAEIAKMKRKAGDAVQPGEEVFVESPKLTNWANYTTGALVVPDVPTSASMRTRGFTLLAGGTDVGGRFMGQASKYASLPAEKNGKAARSGDVAFLNANDIGNGTVFSPQYPRGMYEHNGSVYVQLYTDAPSRSGAFVGSATVYAGLPLTDQDGLAIRTGDWAFLDKDDGPNVRGFYRWAGGSWALSVASPFIRNPLTIAEAQDASNDRAGPISGKTLAAIIAAIPQASTSSPQSITQQQAVAPPSVATVWTPTNATVGAIPTYRVFNDLAGVTFNYTDPEDDAAIAVFSLADLATDFNPSGFYGGLTRFINLTMPNGKPVRIILTKPDSKSISIVVAKPAVTLSVFGKIANVQLTAALPKFREARYEAYSNANARQTAPPGTRLEINTVEFLDGDNERGYVAANLISENRLICPDAGRVTVTTSVYANTASARVSLVHYDSAGNVKRIEPMVAALASGESKASFTFNRIKVAAGDMFGLINAGSSNDDFYRAIGHTGLRVIYQPD